MSYCRSISDLEQEIRNASSEVDHLHRYLRAIHEETLSRTAELIDAHQQEAKTNEELALAMRSSLNSLLMQDMSRLSERVENADGALV
jgi:hypothetical protein